MRVKCMTLQNNGSKNIVKLIVLMAKTFLISPCSLIQFQTTGNILCLHQPPTTPADELIFMIFIGHLSHSKSQEEFGRDQSGGETIVNL